MKEFRFVYEFGFGDWHLQKDFTIEQMEEMARRLNLYNWFKN